MKITDVHSYSDIINMKHHQSVRHKAMSREDRAAQFGAFSALSGHEGAIEETARLTDGKIELEEYEIEFLNAKLQLICDNIEKLPIIKVKYFKPDEKKSGGAYISKQGRIRRIDEVLKLLIFEDGTELDICSVYAIDSDELAFDSLEPSR